MPNKNQREKMILLAWKVFPPIMSNNSVYKFIVISIEKDLINNEKGLTMTFDRDPIFVKTAFCGAIYVSVVTFHQSVRFVRIMRWLSSNLGH